VVEFMITSRCRDPLHASAGGGDVHKYHDRLAGKLGWKCNSELWLKQVEKARQLFEQLYEIF